MEATPRAIITRHSRPLSAYRSSTSVPRRSCDPLCRDLPWLPWRTDPEVPSHHRAMVFVRQFITSRLGTMDTPRACSDSGGRCRRSSEGHRFESSPFGRRPHPRSAARRSLSHDAAANPMDGRPPPCSRGASRRLMEQAEGCRAMALRWARCLWHTSEPRRPARASSSSTYWPPLSVDQASTATSGNALRGPQASTKSTTRSACGSSRSWRRRQVPSSKPVTARFGSGAFPTLKADYIFCSKEEGGRVELEC